MNEIMNVDTAAAIVRQEVDMQIATAKQYPRDITKLEKNLLNMVAPDTDSAIKSMYSLPRGGKQIEGPSIRFAEGLVALWGNCRAGARVISDDGNMITVQGVFHDLESNAAITRELKRRIVDKNGKRYTEDMIAVTANAACSIVFRNAVQAGIPQAHWWHIYEQTRERALGSAGELEQGRINCLEHYSKMGVKEDDLFKFLGISNLKQIDEEMLRDLRTMANSIKNGEISVEEAFDLETTSENAQSLKDRLKKNAGKKADPKPKDELKEEVQQEETDALDPVQAIQDRIAKAETVDDLMAIDNDVAESDLPENKKKFLSEFISRQADKLIA